MEYAKKVPKPKVLPRRNSEDSARALAEESVVDINTDSMTDELQRLRDRHQRERQQVAMLLQNNS